MKLALLLITSLVAFSACRSPEAEQRDEISRHRQYLEDQARVVTVSSSDGISEVEAYKIGKDRFDTYHTACGVVSTPVDSGEFWRVTTYTGVAALPVEDILIRKSDGSITVTQVEIPKAPRQETQPSTQR